MQDIQWILISHNHRMKELGVIIKIIWSNQGKQVSLQVSAPFIWW